MRREMDKPSRGQLLCLLRISEDIVSVECRFQHTHDLSAITVSELNVSRNQSVDSVQPVVDRAPSNMIF